MNRNRTTKFQVTTIYVRSLRGHPFPIDMLRYDNCVPASEQDAHIIQSSHYGSGIELRPGIGTTVMLKKYTGEGVLAFPTSGRWESFGWGVVDVTTINEEESARIAAETRHREAAKLPRSTFRILKTGPVIVIDDQDVGASVTNDAERVCKYLVTMYGDKPIFYYDTIGNFDELVHEKGEFRSYRGAGHHEIEIMGAKR